MVTKGKEGGGGRNLGVWDGQIQTNIYIIDTGSKKQEAWKDGGRDWSLGTSGAKPPTGV